MFIDTSPYFIATRDSYTTTQTPMVLVSILVALRAALVVRMIIPDCDETYNYWDPLNVVLRGFGKQTWEYSPEYAIRLWAYLMVYAVPAWIASKLGVSDQWLFYVVRLAIVLFTVWGEITLYRLIRRQFGKEALNWFMVFSAALTGMAHAGVALLPLLWALQTQLVAVAAALDGHYLTLVVWQFVGGLLGWPFALALGVPVGLTVVIRRQFNTVVGAILAFTLICTLLVAVDLYYYDRLVLVPWNIVKYNVLSGDDGVGPEIFGTEPWTYYPVNLVLNFHVVAVAGYLGAVVNYFFYNPKRVWLVLAPLLIWLAIFFTQPHKEERFLYPIYPLVVANAALLAAAVGRYVRSRLLKVVAAVAVTVVSCLRTAALILHYLAPLTVMSTFWDGNETTSVDQHKSVCVGKEWYHFPTLMLLPENYRLEYIDLGFDGLLPGLFAEGLLLKLRASVVPEGMNNRNQYDPLKVVPESQCDYLIELGAGEDLKGWTRKQCAQMLDPAQPQGWGRLIYLPINRGKVNAMDYCVYERDASV